MNAALDSITMTIKRNLRYKPAVSVRPRFYDLSYEEEAKPTAADNISNAVRLYSTIRTLWRKGNPQEIGVCYVKVRGEFVEIRMRHAKHSG